MTEQAQARNTMVGKDPYAIPLEEYDVSQRELYQSDTVWGFFDRLRKEDPVHYCKDSEFGPYWSITRFDDIMEVEGNPEVFSSQGAISIEEPDEELNVAMFIAMDEPEHSRQRNTVQGAVAPRNLANLEGLIRERAGTILDALPAGETFNWVDKVSIELTGQMLATLFDFPLEQRRKLTYWSDVAMSMPDANGKILSREERNRILTQECAPTFMRMWQERAAAEPRFDLLSMMAHGESTKNMAFERPGEFLGNLLLLIIGGNDTTRNSISGSVLFLHQNPGERDKLRADPELVTNMVPEIIRYQTPVVHMRRTVTRDFTFQGKKFMRGDKVVMWYVSGNRDDTAIEKPYDFIIDRERPRHHLAFGFGIHRCMGNRLAEMQLRVVWEEILKRFDKVEVVGEPLRTPSNFVRGYSQMPVRVTPK